MRIAVIGSGISGLASAWLLSRKHAVTLYEAQDYLGGHTHTHTIRLHERTYAVDSGFIVYNTRHYPLLSRLFSELHIASQPTTMSFAVRSERSGLEYNAGSLQGLFCQRRNLVSPRFLRMLSDLWRFYRCAPRVLEDADCRLTLQEYLLQGAYRSAFRDEHLVPMAAALWSCPPGTVLEFPVRHLVQFMANHQMLQVSGRPTWRVVQGGSSRYVSAMRSRWSVRECVATPVQAVRRAESHVEIHRAGGIDLFDHVILACHSDQALALLTDATSREREILGAIRYQPNEAVLHTDPSLLPGRPATWGAWNVLIPSDASSQCIVSYCMNLLQSLDSPVPLIVSLNAGARIDPARVIGRMRYQHPVFDAAAVAAQTRQAEIQGVRRVWYAGAYWGWGFHEDGLRSAVAVAHALGVQWPEPASGTSAPPAQLEARAA